MTTIIKLKEISALVKNIDVLAAMEKHYSIERAKNYCQKMHLCDYSNLEQALLHAMESNWDVRIN